MGTPGRTITRYRLVRGAVRREDITFAPNDRPSDYEKIMLEGSMPERVLRGYRDLESQQGSALKLPASAEAIKRAWAEPGVNCPEPA